MFSMVVVRYMKKKKMMACPANSSWYEKCAKGIHKRLGDEVHLEMNKGWEKEKLAKNKLNKL